MIRERLKILTRARRHCGQTRVSSRYVGCFVSCQFLNPKPSSLNPETLRPASFILHPTTYFGTLHPTPYCGTLQPTPYTLHPTVAPYTLHPAPYNLHPKPYILKPQFHLPEEETAQIFAGTMVLHYSSLDSLRARLASPPEILSSTRFSYEDLTPDSILVSCPWGNR